MVSRVFVDSTTGGYSKVTGLSIDLVWILFELLSFAKIVVWLLEDTPVSDSFDNIYFSSIVLFNPVYVPFAVTFSETDPFLLVVA